MNEHEYLAAAASSDADRDRDQHCEAWCYAGMHRLMANDRELASNYFRKCLATGRTDFFEYMLAQAELKAITSSN
jgi:hypothetical protein